MTDRIEREQIEQVFGLTGGELSDRPWTYVHESYGMSTDPENRYMPRDDKGRTTDPADVRVESFRYTYDGAPEYTGTDHCERGGTTDKSGRDVRTAVVCALFGMPPAKLWDAADGARWERVAFYQSSGETECPGKHEDVNKVAEEHIGDADPNDANSTCVLCDEEIGTPHGMIYLGDGWGEAVYVRMTPFVEAELIDHGCDSESYFPGAGVAFTKYTDIAIGIGESAHEAAADALDSMAQALPDGLGVPAGIDAEADKLSRTEDAHAGCLVTDASHDDCEWHHYVSVRWRIVKH